MTQCWRLLVVAIGLLTGHASATKRISDRLGYLRLPVCTESSVRRSTASPLGLRDSSSAHKLTPMTILIEFGLGSPAQPQIALLDTGSPLSVVIPTCSHLELPPMVESAYDSCDRLHGFNITASNSVVPTGVNKTINFAQGAVIVDWYKDVISLGGESCSPGLAESSRGRGHVCRLNQLPISRAASA